jgi:hypothetical protein
VDRAELEASAGAASYYSFSPAPGLRFVALDTVANGGVAGVTDKGNLDDPQFEWLERTLKAAQAADELVVVYSHHAPVSMTADVPDEAAGPCDDPDRPTNPGCDMDPRESTPLHLGEDTQALVSEYPHVIAWVAGHSHVNDVEPVKPTLADGQGGFWIVRTSAEARRRRTPPAWARTSWPRSAARSATTTRSATRPPRARPTTATSS